MKINLTFLFILLFNSSFGQSLQAEVDNIYNFKPGKLSKSEQTKKIPTLDAFWNKVKADTAQYLPALRSELDLPGHNPYFYFDGATLLLSASKSRSDKNLAAKAMSKSDLDDLAAQWYVKPLVKLSAEGVNIIPAALKILEKPDFSFYIPEHAMAFTQNYCLAYLLLPQDHRQYVDTLASLFKAAGPAAQKSIIYTFWHANTCTGDALLKSAAADVSLPKEVRDYAKGALGNTALSRADKSFLKTIKTSEAKQARAAAMSRYSDEAIQELEATTKVLRRETSCQ